MELQFQDYSGRDWSSNELDTEVLKGSFQAASDMHASPVKLHYRISR